MGSMVDTKTYMLTFFTNDVWSYSLWSPVIVYSSAVVKGTTVY